MSKRYTDDELLQILKEQFDKNPSIEMKDFNNSNGLPSFVTYRNRFETWNKAKNLAGIHIIKRNMTKEEFANIFKEFVEKIKHIPSVTEIENDKKMPSIRLIYKLFDDYDDLLSYCNLYNNTTSNGKYKDEFLINEIKRFIVEFGRTPIQSDFENLKGYPSRKNYSNHFGTFNNALRLAGISPTKLDEKERIEIHTKDFLISEIYRYIEEFGEIPKSTDIKKNNSYVGVKKYSKIFGSWNNALKEAKIPLNQVSKHEDEFLRLEFERFVFEHGRIPRLHEFNSSEYPSFWCYQNRFGSWNKAVVAYGYEPNDNNRKTIMDDGEICASSYEFDISSWLKQNSVKYDRNIKYIEIIDNYKGKMDCDYKIIQNDKIWYVEMAGFCPRKSLNWDKFSKEEKNYVGKLRYKIKLLKRQGLNYKIIYQDDMKERTLDDIFSFLM